MASKTELCHVVETFKELSPQSLDFLRVKHSPLHSQIKELIDEYDTGLSLMFEKLNKVIIKNKVWTPTKIIRATDDMTTVEFECPTEVETTIRGYEAQKRLNLEGMIYLLKTRGHMNIKMSLQYITTSVSGNGYFDTRFFKIKKSSPREFYLLPSYERGLPFDCSDSIADGDIPVNTPLPIWSKK